MTVVVDVFGGRCGCLLCTRDCILFLLLVGNYESSILDESLVGVDHVTSHMIVEHYTPLSQLKNFVLSTLVLCLTYYLMCWPET